MTRADSPPLLLSDEDLESLEAILVSDVVPEDCMDLEMLDGFLAGVLLSPKPIPREHWLPAIWSAYGEANFGAGIAVQRAIKLVLAYYNEMLTTLGRENEDECWEPFCFAAEEGSDKLAVGEGWIDGFIQGLDLWPEDWRDGLIDEIASAVQDTLRQLVDPWEKDEDDTADDETRLGWLEAAGEAVNGIFARWRYIGLPAPQPVALDEPSLPGAGVGRNEPCPCGSGKKYKKCCGSGDGAAD